MKSSGPRDAEYRRSSRANTPTCRTRRDYSLFGSSTSPRCCRRSTRSVSVFGSISRGWSPNTSETRKPATTADMTINRAPSASIIALSAIDSRNLVRSSGRGIRFTRFTFFFTRLTPSHGLRPSQRFHSAAFVKIAESRLRRSVRVHPFAAQCLLVQACLDAGFVILQQHVPERRQHMVLEMRWYFA